jgi:hypothetical protein
MNEIDQQISKLEAEIQKLKELREKEKEKEKEKESKVKLFDGVNLSDFEKISNRINENAQKVNPQANFGVRILSDLENDGIYLGGSFQSFCAWEIIEDNSAYVLKLKEKDSSDTFEYKGYVWKKWSGKAYRPLDIQCNDEVYYVKKSEFDKNVYTHSSCRADRILWENVVGYFKKY